MHYMDSENVLCNSRIVQLQDCQCVNSPCQTASYTLTAWLACFLHSSSTQGKGAVIEELSLTLDMYFLGNHELLKFPSRYYHPFSLAVFVLSVSVSQ